MWSLAGNVHTVYKLFVWIVVCKVYFLYRYHWEIFVPDQTTSDLILPASMTPNDIEICSSPVSSTTQFITTLTDENQPLVCSDNESSSDSQLLDNMGQCHSHGADGANLLDTRNQETSCSTLEKNGPVLLSDIQTNTSTYSSPSHILHCALNLTSKALTFNNLQRHDASSKSFARRLPRVHKASNFSFSQVVLSRKSSSTRRLYLHHVIRYLNKLLISDMQPQVFQDFYFCLSYSIRTSHPAFSKINWLSDSQSF